MTTKVLTTYLTGSYTLSAAYNALAVRPGAGAAGGVYSNHLTAIYNYGGRLGGFGVALSAGGTVDNGLGGYASASITAVTIEHARGTVLNHGTISAYMDGVVVLEDGGFVLNGGDADTGALISGIGGVYVAAGGTVENFGTIKGLGNSVYLIEGGVVVNGSSSDSRALIQGGEGVFLNLGSGSVTNFGVIDGQVYDGVDLGSGGAVTNGSVIDTAASIIGAAVGVKASGAATVRNFATINETSAAIGDYGVLLNAGGTLVNGSRSDASAMISGYTGVDFAAGGTVNNYGSIAGLGGAYEAGVTISGAARVFNGSAGLIEGGEGVVLADGGIVQNNGTVRGEANYGLGGAGVFLAKGGTVYNGAASDRSALIAGDYGVFSQTSGTVDNLGTITGDYRSAGVELAGGGAVTNGSTRDAAALITGYEGVKLQLAASLANFGTVTGIGGYGVFLDGAGESVVNGSAGHGRASIGGYIGVEVNYGAVTVNNFGTISGYGGTALAVYAGASVLLEVEAGSAFQGAVLGNGASILDLASGTAVTVSGSIATTTFGGFGTVEAGAGAVFTVTGKATVLAGQTLAAAGTLTANGAIANAGVLEALGGTLIVSGAVTGAGSAAINGGTLDFASSFNQAVTFGAGGGTLELAQSQSFTANVTGFSRTSSTSLDLLDIGFVSSTEATFGGTKSGGILTVTDGTHTAHISLKGNYLTATFVASSDGHGGTIVVDPKTKTVASPHQFIAAMAGMGGVAGEAIHTAVERAEPAPMLSRPHTMLS